MINNCYLRQKDRSPKLEDDKIMNKTFTLKDQEYEEFYMLCDEKESGAVKKSLKDIPSNQLLVKEVDIVFTLLRMIISLFFMILERFQREYKKF